MTETETQHVPAGNATPCASPATKRLLWDELFHGCALEAYLTVAAEMNGPPDPEQTRRLAYRLYEERLPLSKSVKPEPAAT